MYNFTALELVNSLESEEKSLIIQNNEDIYIGKNQCAKDREAHPEERGGRYG